MENSKEGKHVPLFRSLFLGGEHRTTLIYYKKNKKTPPPQLYIHTKLSLFTQTRDRATDIISENVLKNTFFLKQVYY